MAGLVVSGLAAAGMTGLLLSGIESRLGYIAVLLGACLAAAVFVVLLPRSWRAKSGLLATAFLAVIGVLPNLVQRGETPAQPQRQVNPEYLANLIRKGPFTEDLPGNSRVLSIDTVQLGSQTALKRLDAVALNTDAQGPTLYMTIETYPASGDATARGAAESQELVQRYAGTEPIRRTGSTFCLAGVYGEGEWFCGGSHGLVYVEVTCSPSSNASLAFATGALNAGFRYTDRLSVLASQ